MFNICYQHQWPSHLAIEAFIFCLDGEAKAWAMQSRYLFNDLNLLLQAFSQQYWGAATQNKFIRNILYAEFQRGIPLSLQYRTKLEWAQKLNLLMTHESLHQVLLGYLPRNIQYHLIAVPKTSEAILNALRNYERIAETQPVGLPNTTHNNINPHKYFSGNSPGNQRHMHERNHYGKFPAIKIDLIIRRPHPRHR